jgi:hypothetical protein
MPTKFADEGFVVLVRIPIERGPAQPRGVSLSSSD